MDRQGQILMPPDYRHGGITKTIIVLLKKMRGTFAVQKFLTFFFIAKAPHICSTKELQCKFENLTSL